jgi:hypothetical protein
MAPAGTSQAITGNERSHNPPRSKQKREQSQAWRLCSVREPERCPVPVGSSQSAVRILLSADWQLPTSGRVTPSVPCEGVSPALQSAVGAQFVGLRDSREAWLAPACSFGDRAGGALPRPSSGDYVSASIPYFFCWALCPRPRGCRQELSGCTRWLCLGSLHRHLLLTLDAPRLPPYILAPLLGQFGLHTCLHFR